MSTRHEECTNASCTKRIAALELQIRQLEESLYNRSEKHRPCETTATGRFVTLEATLPLSPATSPLRDPESEPRAPKVTSPSIIDFAVKTPADYLEPKPSNPRRTDKSVDRFIKTIPRSEQDWQNQRVSGGLTNAAGILEAFGVDGSSIGEASPSGSLQEMFLNHIVKRAEDIVVALRKHDVTDVLHAWVPVIFLAECRVALKLGVELAVVNKALIRVLRTRRLVTDKKEAAETTLKMYRNVTLWITHQMDGLYGRCQHRAFQVFPLAKWTIAMYDKLSKPVFKDRFDEVAEITASDSAALDQSSFPLYPPFIVWAITCRVLGVDCFDEVCQAFDSRTFLKSDFEKWYALLSVQSTTQTPADTQSEAPVGLAQHKRPPADMHMPKPKRQRISGRPKQVASLPTSSDLALSDAEDGISTWDGNLGHTVSAQDSLGENVTASADTTHTDFSQHIHPTESYGTDSLRIDRGTTGDTVHLANSGVFVPPCGFTQSRSQTGLTMMPLAEGPNLDDGSGVQFPLGNNDSFQTAGAAISLDPGNHWSNPETAEGAMSGTHEADYQIDPSTPSAFTEGPYYLYPSEVLVPTQIPLQSSPATVQNMYGYSHVGCNPCLWPTPARPNGSSRTDHVLGVQRPVRF